MTSITIHDVPEELRDSLEVYAIEHGLTLQAYLLQSIAKLPRGRSKSGAEILELADRLFGKYGDIELDLSRNESDRPPVDFDNHTTG
jgi:hypothetical protein